MRRNTERGFTLVEASILLLALAIIGGILAPSIGGMNALARKVRIKEDLGVLCVTLKMMLDDLGDSAFFDPGFAASYGHGASSTSAYSSSAYQASGRTVVDSETRYVRTRAAQARDDCRGGDCYGGGSADEWCVDCNMPRSECGRDCMDDCGEDCRRSHEHVTGVTTQTYRYEAGQAAIGRSRASSSSSFAYGASSFVPGSHARFLGTPVGLLVGHGDIPASAIGATPWQLQVGSVFTRATYGRFPVNIRFGVSTFGSQLIHRDPRAYEYGAGYGAGLSTAAYTGDSFYGYGSSTFSWRGPYIADRIDPDPWGNRYMANVFALHVPPVGTYPATLGRRGYIETFRSAVVCYSAGPNEVIETAFDQPFGWTTGGDDVTVVLAGAGGIR